MANKVSNHLLEIRVKPDSRFLDNRGRVAEYFESLGKFNQWSISTNRIDFTSEKNPEISAFFSFNNLGIKTIPPAKTEDFINLADEYINQTWQFFSHDSIVRIGVKSTFLIEGGKFSDIFTSFKNKFLKLDDNELKHFGGDLVDLAFPLNFVSGENFFNVNMGPMEKKQSKGYFGEDAFENGTFLEIDYFKNEVSPHIIQRHIAQFVKEGANKGEEIVSLICGWLDV